MEDELAPPGRYTTRDVARALGTSTGAVRNLVYRGRLKRVGGTERHPQYAVSEVAALLADRQERSIA
ncbi:hypothetical protein GFH48_19045 [Streptomyces fagopyri]|uniref:Helix-turn-helix domain-containing protein n=1 Tax=Streptomyces fagopyri TaxID=2662397 RepID=A0A5Q0LDD7_9ACTN|nr:helix-turn-helix domain-containing protein [Streptomyces fagopyri]QFZ75085.1 hypothetical protein GFH48_19045 [Streptomyces fagopyri]